MGPSRDAKAVGEEEKKERAVNRQTALLSLDVLARVLGKQHQGAFVGVLDDVTEIVAGEEPSALPGACVCNGLLLWNNTCFLWFGYVCRALCVIGC